MMIEVGNLYTNLGIYFENGKLGALLCIFQNGKGGYFFIKQNKINDYY